jgi:hypothetical protein
MKTILSFFRWGYPYAILWICCVHLTIGFGLIARAQTQNLLVISGLNRFIDLPYVDRYVLAFVLIFGALMALAGLAFEGKASPRVCLGLLIWQYGFVVGGTLSSLVVLIGGAESPSTGVPVDPVVILVVLCYSLYAGLFHTLSILERYVIEPRRRVPG